VSMAAFAGRRLADMAENTAGVLAIELLAACQGVDFRTPLKSSASLEKAKSMLRELVPFYDQDRYFAPDIEKAGSLITSGALNSLAIKDLLPSF
jgi:histidine ammonia-lyase